MKTLAYSALLGLLSTAAFAHSELTASVPADKASVAAAPKELTLTFSEPVRLTALAVSGGGSQKQLGPLPTQGQKEFSIASPDLAQGEYTVSWRALSKDAHVMTGQFTFAVGQPAAAGASHEAHGAGHAGHHAQHGAEQGAQHGAEHGQH
jgi:methionine-rich copper-binding protein CopC